MSEARSYQPIPVHHVPIASYESEWVELYDRLPTGRALRLIELRNANAGDEALSLATVAVLVRAWSLIDATGAPLPATIDAFNELDTDMTQAIAETAKAHCSFLSEASPALPTLSES